MYLIFVNFLTTKFKQIMSGARINTTLHRLLPNCLNRHLSTNLNFIKPSIDIKYNQLFINGKFTDSISGKTIESIDPRNEQIITNVSAAQSEDVDIAIKAAHTSFINGNWSSKSGFHRSKILHKWADLIERDIDYISNLETWDQGKPINDVKSEIDSLLYVIRYFAGFADKIQGKTLPNNDILGKYFSYTLHEPRGVIATIIPWNYPIMMYIWGVTPALACGNSVVIKVSESTPLSGLYIAQLLTEAGLPNGCINVINGLGNIAGKALVTHPLVNKIHFTGSDIIGKQIMKDAANNLTPICLELGGKSPGIIFADADIDIAVENVEFTMFYNSGQTCDSSSRIFVHENVYDEFVEKMVNKTAERKIGDPFCEYVMQGPMTNEKQYKKVLKYMECGENEADVLYDGNSVFNRTDKGYFLGNMIFGNVLDDMIIAKEEIFGPVMAIMKFNDIEDVIRRANDTPYGLAAMIFSNNINTINYVSRALKAGTIWVNCYGINDPSLPFGGYKKSGFGKTNSEYCLTNYLQVKSVTQLLPNDGGWYN
eukprot:430424_1